MRDFKSMKRQRGRNRKGGGGGGGQSNNPNRAFDSNGPEGVKVRGNAQHVYERYQQLARDATSSGDRVLAENFLQHAEHYFRLLRAMQPTRPVTEIVARDTFASGYDIDFEDESGAQAAQFAAEQAAAEGEGSDGEGEQREGREGGQDREFRRDRDQNRDRDRGEGRDRDRDFRRDRDDRDNRDRDRGEGRDRDRDFRRDRDDRDRGEGRRDRDDRPRDRDRDDRQRDDRPRDRDDRGEGEGRRESRRERFERQRGERRPREDREGSDPLAVVEPQASPLVSASEESSPRLRGEDGGESHMPAFLGRSAAPAASDDEAPVEKPKRAPRKRKVAEAPEEA